MEPENRYEIGGKTYTQRPLVLGQWKQLLKALKGVKIPITNDPFVLVEALGDKAPELMAIVLQEEGIRLQDKDISKLTGDLDFAVSPRLILTILDDFFVGNEVFSLLEEISTRMTESIAKAIEMSSTNSASPLAAETLPGATTSSGASL